jgi:hypothetical protein
MTRAEDAMVQVAGIHPALSLHIFRRLQHVQPPALSDLPPPPEHLQSGGYGPLSYLDSRAVRAIRNSATFARLSSSYDKAEEASVSILAPAYYTLINVINPL